MLEQMAASTFAPHLNTVFRLALNGEHLTDLKLIEVSEPSQSGRTGALPPHTDHRLPFALLFVGPRLLPQQIYDLSHDTLGECTLFLVPIGEGPDGVRYQAVFN